MMAPPIQLPAEEREEVCVCVCARARVCERHVLLC